MGMIFEKKILNVTFGKKVADGSFCTFDCYKLKK